MRPAYLETSAINHALRDHHQPADVRARLAAGGLVPVVGLHVIYELAITFLKSAKHDLACRLFTFLRDLDPSYSPGSSGLLIQEVVRLRTGAVVLPFMDHVNQVVTRLEVERLAAGIFDHQARSFIEARETEIREAHPVAMSEYISHVRRLATANPGAVADIRTEDDLLSRLRPKVPSMIREILRGAVSMPEARELFLRLSEFRALRAALYANLALMLTCIDQRVAPADDKLDDYRHVIEAAYCDVLITDDLQLLAKTSVIHPGLNATTLAQVLGGHGG